MSTPLRLLQKTVFTVITASLIASAPAAVTFAADPAPCTPPPQTQPGVHVPTGADASMFTYQCDGSYADMWTSAHYIFNPADSSRTPLVAPVYTYDDVTGQWDYPWWSFSAAKGDYVLTTLSVSTPPAGAETVGGPTPVTPPANNDTPSGSPSSTSPTTNTAVTPNTQAPTVDSNGVASNGVNNTTGASMNNGIVSFAGSGNATVAGNTIGGNAATGTADAIATVINMLQSSSNVLGSPGVTTFTANINGNVNGDLLLDPTKLGAVQPANTSTSLDNNTVINNTANAAMNNTVNLDAQTGNANVTSNSQAGNATTGNANAVANIVNTLNSYVTAGKSFIGVININGNLNGDILLPPDFVDTLLASNVPHYAITTNLNNQTTVTNVNNATVQNNVKLASATGSATVDNNTGAGSAMTGNALTNLTVFNLTGSNVVASNDLLVFVNVLGTWYGMILNAPAGSTAAELGGGVTSNNSITNNTTLNNTNNQSITNNVNVGAKSGNAAVTDNTSAGNAQTGNATASVNLMNLINDRLSLNGWFGLLFINVFGTWNGSFGINTPAGDPVTVPQSSGNSATGPMFQFVPTTGAGGYGGAATVPQTTDSSIPSLPTPPTQTAVLAAHTNKVAGTLPQLVEGGSQSLLLPFMGGVLALVIVLFGERHRLFRHS